MNDNLLQHDQATLAHINEVRENIWLLIKELDNRAQIHDASAYITDLREDYNSAEEAAEAWHQYMINKYETT